MYASQLQKGSYHYVLEEAAVEAKDENWPLPGVMQKHEPLLVSKPFRKRFAWSRRVIIVVFLTFVMVVLALVLGIVFGLQTQHQADNNSGKNNMTTQSAQTGNSTASDNSGGPFACSQPFSDTFVRARGWQGVNLGNWLILERWMNPSYYAFYTDNNKTDEWSFCQSLGSKCGSTLEQHWNDWVVEDDISQLSRAGFNLIRVPIGYWAFIAPEPQEYYYFGNQTAQLTRLLSYAKTLNISVVIDLHGLPGSQNGLEHSGHEGAIDFFNSTNQARASLMLDAVFRFVEESTYQSQIVAVEVANEPTVSSTHNLSVYKKYLASAYSKLKQTNKKLGSEITMMFHDGFIGAAAYNDVFGVCDIVVVDLHQYFFDSGTTQQAVQQAVCSLDSGETPLIARLRTFVGEWSLSSPSPYGGNLSWYKVLFETQAAIYARTTGFAFWSFKAYDDAGTDQNNAWSVQGLISSGTIHANVTWQFSDRFPC